MTRFDVGLRALIPALLATAGACQLPLDHAACPCADGWVCCPASGVCASSADQCTGSSGDGPGGDAPMSGDDAPMSGGGEITEIQRLQMEHGWSADQLGSAVVLRDDLAVVGVPDRDGTARDQGMVVVFGRRGGQGVWVRVAALASPSPVAAGNLGSALALVGTQQLLVGAPGEGPGRVYLFQRGAAGWALQQTLEPDVTGLTADQAAALRFGRVIAADTGRAAIGTNGSAAELYDVTPAGAAHLARLDLPFTVGSIAAVAGSSVVAVGNASSQFGGVYVYDEARGWTDPVLVTQSSMSPTAVAYDGQRLAVGLFKGVRVIERSASGWSAPVDVAWPGPGELYAPSLAWRSGEIDAVLTDFSALRGVELGRVRSVGGTWQVDPAIQIGSELGDTTRIAASGDRVMVGSPFASVNGVNVGLSTLYRVDDAGFTEDVTLGFDEAPLATLGWLAASRGQLVASLAFQQASAWFAQDTDGSYQRRPSLVLPASDTEVLGPPVLAGRHALVPVRSSDARNQFQSFELGDHDWTAGPALPVPAGIEIPSTTVLAADGNTAAVGARWTDGSGVGAVAVYAWRDGAWLAAASIDPQLFCASSIALSGDRIAVACGAAIRMFARFGDTWYEMPAPVLGEPSTGIIRVALAGDVLGIASAASSDGHVATDVFRWTGSTWHGELHVRSDRSTINCPTACDEIGLAALAADRLVLFRDRLSVAPYQFIAGAWVAQAPVALPSASTSPDALVVQAVIADGALALWVPAEGDGLAPRAGAVHVFRWP